MLKLTFALFQIVHELYNDSEEKLEDTKMQWPKDMSLVPYLEEDEKDKQRYT